MSSVRCHGCIRCGLAGYGIGERHYSDGRWFLDFGVRPEWIEANSDYRFIAGRHDNPVWQCPDCEGIDGAHQKISLPDRDGGKPLIVKCPQEPKRSWGRS